MEQDNRTIDEILENLPNSIEYLTKNSWADNVGKVNTYYLNFAKPGDRYCIWYELRSFDGPDDSLPNEWNHITDEPGSGYIANSSFKGAVLEMEKWLKENKYL